MAGWLMARGWGRRVSLNRRCRTFSSASRKSTLAAKPLARSWRKTCGNCLRKSRSRMSTTRAERCSSAESRMRSAKRGMRAEGRLSTQNQPLSSRARATCVFPEPLRPVMIRIRGSVRRPRARRASSRRSVPRRRSSPVRRSSSRRRSSPPRRFTARTAWRAARGLNAPSGARRARDGRRRRAGATAAPPPVRPSRSSRPPAPRSAAPHRTRVP